MIKKFHLVALAGVLSAAVACSDNPPSPAAPSGAGVVDDTDAAADGSTLKVPAPTQTAPANGANIDQFEATLRVNPVTATYVNVTTFAYRFQLLVNNQVVRDFRTSLTTEWRVTNLDVNVTYGWRCRAERGSSVGPWSSTWTFKTPDVPQGYIAGGEVYDPLWNGKSVGTINGPFDFVPNTGIQLHDHTSNVEYILPQTVIHGEYSLLVTNTPANTEGGKTKIMSMAEGRSDITTNDRRFTIEKRGDPPGVIAFRIISHESQEETVGSERVAVDFLADRWYFWRATWGAGRFQLTIQEGGPSGPMLYSFGKNYEGEYDPNPHHAWIGSPVGRGGPPDATVPGMIAKQVWISSRARPDFANK
jgi:hypothetical protein